MSTATATATRITLITGANRGLGRSAALKLAEQGSDLILTYRSHAGEAGEVVARAQSLGRRAVALPLDVTATASFPAFAAQVRTALREHWQREQFDALVNNAGFGAHATVADTTADDFDRLFAVHLKGPFFLTQAPLIADGGRMLNVSSGLTRFAVPGYAAYAAMKGGVEVLTRYLGKELGPRGITANVIAPGAIETDFGGGQVRDNAELNRFLASQTALGRVGQPDDIGEAIAGLLAPGQRWMTAQRVEVSGGMFL